MNKRLSIYSFVTLGYFFILQGCTKSYFSQLDAQNTTGQSTLNVSSVPSNSQSTDLNALNVIKSNDSEQVNPRVSDFLETAVCQDRLQRYKSLQALSKSGGRDNPFLSKSSTPCRYMSDEFLLNSFSYHLAPGILNPRIGYFTYVNDLDIALVREASQELKLSANGQRSSIDFKINISNSLSGFLSNSEAQILAETSLVPAADFAETENGFANIKAMIVSDEINFRFNVNFRNLLSRTQIGQTVVLPFLIFVYNPRYQARYGGLQAQFGIDFYYEIILIKARIVASDQDHSKNIEIDLRN